MLGQGSMGAGGRPSTASVWVRFFWAGPWVSRSWFSISCFSEQQGIIQRAGSHHVKSGGFPICDQLAGDGEILSVTAASLVPPSQNSCPQQLVSCCRLLLLGTGVCLWTHGWAVVWGQAWLDASLGISVRTAPVVHLLSFCLWENLGTKPQEEQGQVGSSAGHIREAAEEAEMLKHVHSHYSGHLHVLLLCPDVPGCPHPPPGLP